jgi:multiple sugar transport system substrate-binding protein
MTEPVSRRRLLGGAVALGALGAATGLSASGCGTIASAGTRVRFWNLFTGGDGSVMATMLAAFRKAHPEIPLDAVTLSWGAPYYTKLAMAAAGGRSPEVAILHLTRLPGFAPGRLLDPFDEGLLAEEGVTAADFLPGIWQRAHAHGRLYAVPLDTHPQVMYYNVDLCRKAGLIGPDGRLRPIAGEEGVLAALRAAKAAGAKTALALDTQDVAPWRLFWGLYRQQGGTVSLPVGGRMGIDRAKALRALTFMRRIFAEGLSSPGADGIGAPALFTSGQAAFSWDGDWQIAPNLAAGLRFDMVPFPTVYDAPGAAADSHSFVLPHQRHRDPDRERATYRFIAYLLKNSITWAGAGHIPAFQPVVGSPAYAHLKPQANYRSAADHVQLDPPAWFTGSASQMETQAGAAFGAVENGAISPEHGLAQFESMVNGLLGTPSPV